MVAPSSKQIRINPRFLPKNRTSLPGVDLNMPAMPSGTMPTFPPRRGTAVLKRWPFLSRIRGSSCKLLFSDPRSAGIAQREAAAYRKPGTLVITLAPAVYCSNPTIQRLKKTHVMAPQFNTPCGHANVTTGVPTGFSSTAGVPARWQLGSLRSINNVIVKYFAKMTPMRFLRYHGRYFGIGWNARKPKVGSHHRKSAGRVASIPQVTTGINRGTPRTNMKYKTARASSPKVIGQGALGLVIFSGFLVTLAIASYWALCSKLKKFTGSLEC
mmetsp:Transcript_46687/g.132684  ORF Transcript_46687/g.132684 Transcript_46687/m.132684 type:complete len:270 (-) Transcript_46687:6-815(-)